MHRILLAIVLGLGLAHATEPPPAKAAAAHTKSAASAQPSSDEVMQRLRAGNERYRNDVRKNVSFSAARAATSTSQHPWCTVLSCADSRVPPEIVFDTGVGELFTVRVAGEVAEPSTTGSVEYASEHLDVPTIVVMGHEGCGAVKAALGTDDLGPNLEFLLSRIRPALKGTTDLSRAVRINVYQQIEALLGSHIIEERVHAGELNLMGAVYDLDTGLVDWLPPSTTRVTPPRAADREAKRTTRRAGKGGGKGGHSSGH